MRDQIQPTRKPLRDKTLTPYRSFTATPSSVVLEGSMMDVMSATRKTREGAGGEDLARGCQPFFFRSGTR